MSKIKYFLIAIMAIFLASCKGESAPIKPESTSLEGNLSTYYEVVDKEYTFAEDGTLTLDIKKIKDNFPEPWHTGLKYSYPPSDSTEYSLVFEITFLDEKGNIVGSALFNYAQAQALAELKNGDSTKLQLFKGEMFSEHQINDDTREKAVTFRVSGKVVRGEGSPSSSSSEVTEATTETTDASSEISTEEATEDNSSSSSEDYDAVLDEYEEYTKNLVSMVKKLNAGDMSVYADYMGLVENMTSLDKKLANAKKEMTNAQAARFLRIQAKYLKALSKAK